MQHRLKEIRKVHNLSQSQMAEIMGLSLRGYQYVEKNERELQLKYVRRAAKALNADEADFFENTISHSTNAIRLLGEAFISADPTTQQTVATLLRINPLKPEQASATIVTDAAERDLLAAYRNLSSEQQANLSAITKGLTK